MHVRVHERKHAILSCAHRVGSLVLGSSGLDAVEMGFRVALCGGGLDAARRCSSPLAPCVHALSASVWKIAPHQPCAQGVRHELSLI